MQMYKGLPIITNKLSEEEQRGIPHHLLGNIGLDESPWSVVEFKREASRIISEIRSRGKLPIVVGGTTYYLDGLLFNDRLVKAEPQPDTEVLTREELETKFPILREPADVMLAKLREVDPIMADRWHPNDDRKIRNSLEIYYTTGRRASDIYAEQRKRRESKCTRPDKEAPQSPWNVLLFWLYAEREPLNARLDNRVEKMVQNGLLDEVAGLHDWYQSKLASGESVDRTRGIVQSIGFWQFEPYLRMLREFPEASEVAQLKKAGIEDMKPATRRYAKYQVRWITMKTLVSLQQDKLLDKLYLLDGTDVETWPTEVAAKGVTLTKKFLAGESLPRPVALSQIAQDVLTQKVERSNRQATPCNKTCSLCSKTFLTEQGWEGHIKSNRHAQKARQAKRSALVSHDPRERAMVATNMGDTEMSAQDPGGP